jgi:hypothetical protein
VLELDYYARFAIDEYGFAILEISSTYSHGYVPFDY